jgi:hypothetical protein
MISASLLLSLSALALSWALFDVVSTIRGGGLPSYLAGYFELVLLFWMGHLVFPVILFIGAPLIAVRCLSILMLGQNPPKDRRVRRRVLKERWDSKFLMQSLVLYVTTALLYVLSFELMSPDYWPLMTTWIPGPLLFSSLLGGWLIQSWLSIRRRGPVGRARD